VHREDLVVQIGTEHVVVGSRQLQPYQRREDPGQSEEAERGDDEPDADRLVIDAGEPADETGRFAPGVRELTGLVRQHGRLQMLFGRDRPVHLSVSR
jgi:hypothetical protein